MSRWEGNAYSDAGGAEAGAVELDAIFAGYDSKFWVEVCGGILRGLSRKVNEKSDKE